MNTALKNKSEFNLRSLSFCDVSEIIHLQNEVLKSLSDREKHFFKYRDSNMLQAHLNGDMPLLGLNEGGQLAAMVMLTHPDNPKANNLEGYPVASNEKDQVTVIQSLLVSPRLQGLGLSSNMIRAAAEFSLQASRGVLCAKVAQENTKSTQTFMRNGFKVVSRGNDYRRGYPVQYMKASAKIVLPSRC